MKTARTSVIVSILSVVVTAVSLANQLVIARSFGASTMFDQFLEATSLPFLVSGAFTGLFAYAMIPALIRATTGTESPERSRSAFLFAVVVAAAAVAAIGAATAPWTLRLYTMPGGGHDPSPTMLSLAYVAWLGTGLSVIVGFCGAVLNSRSRFVLPVAASALPYVGMIVAVLATGARYGALSLTWGLVAGVALSVILLLLAGRGSFVVRGVSARHFSHVRLFFANAPLALLSTLTFSVYQSIDSFWAPRLGPSNLSVLGYCQRMLIAVGAVMAAGPSVVLQPRLAAASARGDDAAFISDLGRGLRLTVLICAPAALGLSLLAHPIVRLAFERGAFTREATMAVAGMLPWMLAGMVPMVCTVMLFKAFYAKADIRTAALLGVGGPISYFALSGVFMRFFGLSGIGLAYLLTWTALAGIGIVSVSERASALLFQWRFGRDLALVLAAVAVPAYILRRTLLGDWGVIPVRSLLPRLAAAAVIGVGSYLGVGLLVARVDDLRLLARGVLPSRPARTSP